jgi:ABC-2 type transport system permease protein
VRGEMIWPAAVLTLVSWTLIAISWLLSAAVFPRAAAGRRLSIAGSAAIVTPAVIAAQFHIHNAAALILPAWATLGRTRGLDAMGQRLIVLGGTLLMLATFALPGMLAGALVWFALRQWIGGAALVLGAMACAAFIFLEVLVGTEALGPAYDRLDLLSIEKDE